MQQVPQLGQILYYKDFQFEDGSSTDKLFVILYVSDINSPCLVLKTTSQSKRYAGVKEGCNPQKKVFFIPVDWRECFPLDTYIQLPQIIEIPAAEIFAGTLSKRIYVKNALSAGCFAQLNNCLKQFRRDISQEHWHLIFKS